MIYVRSAHGILCQDGSEIFVDRDRSGSFSVKMKTATPSDSAVFIKRIAYDEIDSILNEIELNLRNNGCIVLRSESCGDSKKFTILN